MNWNLIDERSKNILFLCFAFILFIPFVFLGYGTDGDSGLVIRTGQLLLTQHTYVFSRPPGYPVYEFALAILNLLGGSILTNLSSVAFSLTSLYVFLKICERYRVEHRFLLATLLVMNPIYWVWSTATMDYIWALGLCFIGYYCWINKAYVLAGIFGGLATGTRLTSILFFLALFLSSLVAKESNLKEKMYSLGIAIVIGLLFYVPSFNCAGINFLFSPVSGVGGWGPLNLFRFAYKNVYLFGLQMVLLLVVWSRLIVTSYLKNINYYDKGFVVFLALMILFYELLFFKYPIEIAYLLPMLPFVVYFIGISLKSNKQAKTILLVLIFVQFSYNLVNFNIGSPNTPNNATKFYWQFKAEPGYLLNDSLERFNGDVDGRKKGNI